MSIYAFLVGIDRYDEPGFSISGPCGNAIAVTQRALALGVPRENVFLFLAPKDEQFDAEIAGLKAGHVQVCSADSNTIDSFLRRTLPEVGPADSSLFFYWSGHGVADKDGDRILLYSDYHAQGNLTNRVFNATKFLRHLRSQAYQRFTRQIFLADACANHLNMPIEANKALPANFHGATRQFCCYATPEGEYARGNDGRGAFTDIVLEAFAGLLEWPGPLPFETALGESLKRSGHKAFRVYSATETEERGDQIFGRRADPNSKLATEVYELLLSVPNLPDSLFVPHYLRTMRALNEPGLAIAQGLLGMVQELSSVGKTGDPQTIPKGLVQFLVRLANEARLKRAINKWLKAKKDVLGNSIANARERLKAEEKVKLLVIEIARAWQGGIDYEAFLRAYDLRPLEGLPGGARTVSGWDEFRTELIACMRKVQEEYARSDIELHFVVESQLFDQAFHTIKSADGAPLGDEHVVVVHHRKRLRSANTTQKEIWETYARKVREKRPAELKVFGVPAGAGPQLLPAEEGLCYVNVGIPASGGAPSANEKQIVQSLLVNGVPYLYWLHCPVKDTEWPQLAEFLDALLRRVRTLDDAPGRLLVERRAATDLAQRVTLLWDDPIFNPFELTQGLGAI